MGQSQSLSCEVEIQAPPAAVRSVFLDFPRYKQWSKWNINPVESHKSPSDLRPDDRVKVYLDGMSFSPSVRENLPEVFSWDGSFYGLLAGKHQFHFYPSKKYLGGTTFTQVEEFRGLLAFLMGPGWGPRKSTLKNWTRFSGDLKKEVERASSA